MRFQRFLKRKFNHKTTEGSADVLLATLVFSGWLACLVSYFAIN